MGSLALQTGTLLCSRGKARGAALALATSTITSSLRLSSLATPSRQQILAQCHSSTRRGARETVLTPHPRAGSSRPVSCLSRFGACRLRRAHTRRGTTLRLKQRQLLMTDVNGLGQATLALPALLLSSQASPGQAARLNYQLRGRRSRCLLGQDMGVRLKLILDNPKS